MALEATGPTPEIRRVGWDRVFAAAVGAACTDFYPNPSLCVDDFDGTPRDRPPIGGVPQLAVDGRDVIQHDTGLTEQMHSFVGSPRTVVRTAIPPAVGYIRSNCDARVRIGRA